MDKDGITGAVERAKGAVKEQVGRLTRNTNLAAEDKVERAAGKVQDAAGGAKNAARGAMAKGATGPNRAAADVATPPSQRARRRSARPTHHPSPSRRTPPVSRPFAAAALGVVVAGMPATAPRAETVWSRWSGAWEVALDRQPDGATCLWSTYDTPPPGHVRRLTFAVNRRGEVVVIVSDRREPLHRITPASSGLLALGGRRYVVEIGAGVPLVGLPGGMLIGRVAGEDAVRFAHVFGQHGGEDGDARLALPGGWSWRLSMRGAAAAAEDVASCMAEAPPGGRVR
jgi:uncharacterized protein YjbJ (UPF0337 family)